MFLIAVDENQPSEKAAQIAAQFQLYQQSMHFVRHVGFQIINTSVCGSTNVNVSSNTATHQTLPDQRDAREVIAVDLIALRRAVRGVR